MLADLLAITLGNAAANGNDAFSTWRLWGAYHRRCLPIEALVGVLTDTARHEDDNIRLLRFGHANAAVLLEKALNALGIVKIHLAAESLYVIGLTNKRIH